MSEQENKKGFNHIAADVVFNGAITFHGKLIVSGLLLGEIHGEDGDLELTQHGEMRGERKLNSIHVRGKISGKTSATTAHLYSSSTSHSDFLVSEIIVDNKAMINGNIIMPEQPTAY